MDMISLYPYLVYARDCWFCR